MKRVLSGLIISIVALLPSAAIAQQFEVMGYDNAFLGAVINGLEENSICNQFTYGSQFTESIFNRFGVYGGQTSPYGAYNPSAEKPPVLLKDGEFVAFISKNRQFKHRIDPDTFFSKACMH